MKKLLLILITAVVGLVAHADKTIYYDNSATGWTTVNIHYWGSETGDAAMTKVAGSVYKATIPDGATGMAFQKAKGNWNNGECTQNAPSCEDKHLYYGSGDNSSKYNCADNGAAGEYTVYFYADNENAIDVYCHIWTASDGDITTWASCPKMSDTGKYVKIGNDYHKAYSYTFVTTKTPARILFKKSAGEGDKYNDNCTFSNGKFYKNANGATCSPETQSLVDKGGVEPGPTPDPDPTPDEDGYYVYFVNNNNWGSVNIWAWNGSDNNLTNASGWPGDQMQLVSGNTYIWRLPEGKGVPTNVKFSNNGANVTDDLVFKNHATYYPDGTIVEEIVRGANILYCHFKTDRSRRGHPGAVPMCHVFGPKGGLTTWGDNRPNKDGGEQMEKIDDPTNNEQDEYLTERYELWRFVIPEEEFATGDYNDAIFYVTKDTNNENFDDDHASKWQISQGWGENRNNYLKENWTKYIYSTFSCNKDGKDVNYAVPTYVTPSEFLTLHQKKVVEKGRDGIFIVGPSNDFKYKDAATGNWLQFSNYKPLSNRRLTPDDGVFYLEVQPNENSYDKYTDGKVTGCEGNKFKLSWMDVVGQKNTAETREGGASSVNEQLAADRNWATFDLGSIGIDTKLVPSEDYAPDAGPAGRVKFQLNRPYKYTNNNACDWFICEQTAKSRWIILDTHYDSKDENYQCETVTITDFDPHPSMSATLKEFNNNTDLPAGAPAHPHLYAHAANDHVDMKCNSAHATATIVASTTNSAFTRNYEVEFNGVKAVDVPGNVKSFDYNYFPFNVAEKSLKVRARYEQNATVNGTSTKMRFHSRTGDGKIDGLTITAPDPAAQGVTGLYIEEFEEHEYEKDTNGNVLIVDGKKVLKYCNRKFGVLVPDFNINFNGTYEYGDNKGDLCAYADYRVFDQNGKEITDNCKLYTQAYAAIADRNHLNTMITASKRVSGPWNANGNWAKALKDETQAAPLYIENVHEGYVDDASKLPEQTYTIVLQAVYPLVYQTGFTPVASTSSVNGELVPAAKTAATTGPSYNTTHVRKTRTITVNVTHSTSVSGVDDVFGDAEADNADAPAEYYTISGVRVTGDPAPGIYVVRRGNKVTKEVVK